MENLLILGMDLNFLFFYMIILELSLISSNYDSDCNFGFLILFWSINGSYVNFSSCQAFL